MRLKKGFLKKDSKIGITIFWYIQFISVLLFLFLKILILPSLGDVLNLCSEWNASRHFWRHNHLAQKSFSLFSWSAFQQQPLCLICRTSASTFFAGSYTL